MQGLRLRCPDFKKTNAPYAKGMEIRPAQAQALHKS